MDARLEVLREEDFVFLLNHGSVMVSRGEEGRVWAGELRGVLRVCTSKEQVLRHEPESAPQSLPQAVRSVACCDEAIAFGTEREEVLVQASLQGPRSPALAASSPARGEIVA
eukprot:1758108-Rhodomonas_salina.1